MKQTIRRLKTLNWQPMLAFVFLPSRSFATNIESVLENTVDYLQGGVARGIGVLALIGVGYLCMFKQIFPKVYFAMVLVGLGFIFGASELYERLAGY